MPGGRRATVFGASAHRCQREQNGSPRRRAGLNRLVHQPATLQRNGGNG